MVFGIIELAAVICLAMGAMELITASCMAANARRLNYTEGLGQVQREEDAFLCAPILPLSVRPLDVISIKITGTVGSCSICFEDYANSKGQRLTACGHIFCSECFEKWYEKAARCPLCNTEFT